MDLALEHVASERTSREHPPKKFGGSPLFAPASTRWAISAAVAAAALMAQGVAIRFGPDLSVRIALPVAIALVLAIACQGWRSFGMRVVIAGLLFNLLAIASNGGLMPISPETLEAASARDYAAAQSVGDRLAGSKDVLLAVEDTRLAMFSDAIPVAAGPIRLAASVGDLLIVAGLVVAGAGWARGKRSESHRSHSGVTIAVAPSCRITR